MDLVSLVAASAAIAVSCGAWRVCACSSGVVICGGLSAALCVWCCGAFDVWWLCVCLAFASVAAAAMVRAAAAAISGEESMGGSILLWRPES